MSEVFPLEIRAMAIAFFYAVGTALGGIIGPVLFGKLIGSKSFTEMMVGFLIAAAWLIAAAVTAWFLAVDAEGKPLEEIAEPLSAAGDDENGASDEADPPRAARDLRLPVARRRALVAAVLLPRCQRPTRGPGRCDRARRRASPIARCPSASCSRARMRATGDRALPAARSAGRSPRGASCASGSGYVAARSRV